MATPAHKKALEQAQIKKKPESKKAPKSDNKENEPPAISKSNLNKRQQKESEKEAAATLKGKTLEKTSAERVTRNKAQQQSPVKKKGVQQSFVELRK